MQLLRALHVVARLSGPGEMQGARHALLNMARTWSLYEAMPGKRQVRALARVHQSKPTLSSAFKMMRRAQVCRSGRQCLCLLSFCTHGAYACDTKHDIGCAKVHQRTIVELSSELRSDAPARAVQCQKKYDRVLLA
jgi:hypothetical protein